MEVTFRKIKKGEENAVIDMMREFYTSPAVFTNGSEEIFNNNLNACIKDSPYLDGYVFIVEEEIVGYGMIAKSFSTEFGKPCIWIEDIYVKDEYRGLGLGKALMDFVLSRYTDCIFRLEAEEENGKAIALYEKCGFSVLPYLEMKK